MKQPCTLCNEEGIGPEAMILVVLPQGEPFWFCCLGCLVSWGERQMLERAERAER